MNQKRTIEQEIIRILTTFCGEPVYKTITTGNDGVGVAVPVYTLGGQK